MEITQYTRYLFVGLALLNVLVTPVLLVVVVYLLYLWRAPAQFENFLVVFTMLVGAIIIMWPGEVITQQGVGNGMVLSSQTSWLDFQSPTSSVTTAEILFLPLLLLWLCSLLFRSLFTLSVVSVVFLYQLC